MKNFKFSAAITMAIALMMPTQAAQAQWRSGWTPSWKETRHTDSDSFDRYANSRSVPSSRADEGRIEVTRFVSSEPEAALLGHGPISVESTSGDGTLVDTSLRRTFEAAIIDALITVGYDTLNSNTPQPQIAKTTITRSIASPAEEARKPVSGTAAMQVGTRGSAYGIGIDVDLSKPRKALISTRLDLRITHKESGKVLWEGYATILTREGGGNASNGLIATKLSRALLEEFPKADTITPTKEP